MVGFRIRQRQQPQSFRLRAPGFRQRAPIQMLAQIEMRFHSQMRKFSRHANRRSRPPTPVARSAGNKNAADDKAIAPVCPAPRVFPTRGLVNAAMVACGRVGVRYEEIAALNFQMAHRRGNQPCQRRSQFWDANQSDKLKNGFTPRCAWNREYARRHRAPVVAEQTAGLVPSADDLDVAPESAGIMIIPHKIGGIVHAPNAKRQGPYRGRLRQRKVGRNSVHSSTSPATIRAASSTERATPANAANRSDSSSNALS